MTPAVFEQSLIRAVECRESTREHFDDDVNLRLCGLGEPLLNKHVPEFVEQSRDAGFDTAMSSNGALLDERRSRAVLDAGLQKILINVADHDDAYEDVYRLPYARTRDNVIRFAEMAEGRCEVYIVLVDYRRDADHIAAMERYWRKHGIRAFMTYDVMNRGGALFVDHMQYASYPEQTQARAMLEESDVVPVCVAPFVYLFIGYDGQYYLCCSDWKKEVPLGSVFDESFRSITAQKLATVRSRAPVCNTCNIDPLNTLTDELRAVAAGEKDQASVKATLTSMRRVAEEVEASLEAVDPGVTTRRTRTLIPVREG